MDEGEEEDGGRRGMATVAASEEGMTAAPQEGQKRLGAVNSVAQEGQRSMRKPWIYCITNTALPRRVSQDYGSPACAAWRRISRGISSIWAIPQRRNRAVA